MLLILLTSLSLIAFAANSILCRVALGHQYIDPAGFTIIRLLSGSIALYFIYSIHRYRNNLQSSKGKHIIGATKGSWLGSVFLFIYAISFSYAYGYLYTGTGALILFGAVQISMVVYTLFTQRRLLKIEWLGFIIACGGFVYLVYPDLTAPSVIGFLLMMISGVSWAGYTLIGKASKFPLEDTCYNFFRTIPYVVVLTLLTLTITKYSYYGVLLAITSGVVMSAIGYAIWYKALDGLTTTKAAVLQLFVPVIAALGGIIFMNEVMTLRLQISTVTIMLGIIVVLISKHLLTFKLK